MVKVSCKTYSEHALCVGADAELESNVKVKNHSKPNSAVGAECLESLHNVAYFRFTTKSSSVYLQFGLSNSHDSLFWGRNGKFFPCRFDPVCTT